MFLRIATAALLAGLPVRAAQLPPAGASGDNPPQYTVESASEALVWRIFLQQIVAHQERARELQRVQENESAAEAERRANQVRAVRERPQRISGLNAANFAFLSSIANYYVRQMEEWRTKANAIAQNKSGGQLRPEDRTEAAGLWKTREEILFRAMGQIREYFGTTRFQELDRRIREHVVPRLGRDGQSVNRSPQQGEGK